MSIKEIIKGNTVYFHYLRANVAFYKVKYNEEWYMFPVPLEDIGDATLLDEDKAIMFMRYIKKALDNAAFVKIV